MKPISITLACIFLSITSAVTIGILLSQDSLAFETRSQLPGATAMIGLSLFALGCAVGFWNMRRWAIVAYSVASLVPVAVLGMSFATQLPLVIAMLGLMNWSHLR